MRRPKFIRHTGQEKRFAREAWSTHNDDGIEFVRCRICGDHRRVISGRHLSKHGTDREEYMDEYHLSPDDLIAKGFRKIQSSRRGYQHTEGASGSRRSRRFTNEAEASWPGSYNTTSPHLYQQGVWLFGN